LMDPELNTSTKRISFFECWYYGWIYETVEMRVELLL
jgi:hypothetical protein